MQLLSAALASLLAWAPVPTRALALPTVSLGREGSDETAKALALELQVAEQKANEDPSAGIAPLREALDRYEALAFEVTRDSKAHEARIYALLSLARAYLTLEQREEAQLTMDETIRIARGDALPIRTFGPRLVELYESRASAPENLPNGQLVVQCTPACDVLLNARFAGSGRKVELSNVPLGPHRVRVRAVDSGIDASLDERIVMTAEEPLVTLEFPKATEDEMNASEPEGATPALPDSPAHAHRMLPRWAGILGVATGAAAMVAGGVLLGFHGRCPDGSDPGGETPCVNVLNTRAPGIAMLAIGGAAFTGFGVVLIVDETRVRRNRTAGAMLGYTIRF